MTDEQLTLLRDFARAWHDWAVAGGGEHPAFERQKGLCLSALRFGGDECQIAVESWLNKKYGTCFDPYGDYYERRSTETMHLSPERHRDTAEMAGIDVEAVS